MFYMHKRLHQLLERSNKTHWQLAKDMNVVVETVRGWLRGGSHPGRKNINRLSKHFNVHPAYLEYGMDSEIVQMITELQEYEPETFEKLKQV